jgi:hypothetical protein
MAIAWTELTQGSDTTNNPATTASVSPTSGAVVYAAVLVAAEGGGSMVAGDSLAVSGAGLTWALVGSQVYNRRKVFVMCGTGTPSAGALTLTYTPSGANVFAEFMWSVDEATGVDTGDPDDAAVTASTAAATALATGDVGTPGTDDHIYAAFGIEGAAVSALIDDGTALTNLGGGTDCRTLVVFYDANHSDETPSITWTGTNSAGGVGFIVNAAAGGGGTFHTGLLSLLGAGRGSYTA